MGSAVFRWIAPVVLLAALVAPAPGQEVTIVPPAPTQPVAWPPSIPGEKPYAAVLSQLPDPDAVSITFDNLIVKPRLEGLAKTLSRVNTNSFGRIILPGAEQDWAWSPRLTLEGVIDPGLGSAVGTFRMMGSSGDTLLPELRAARNTLVEPARTLHTFTDLNEGIVGYKSPSLLPFAGHDLRVGAGGRIASVFFSSEALSKGPELVSSVGSFFIGFGPSVFTEYNAQVLQTPLWLHFGGNAGGLFGQARQRFAQRFQRGRTITTSRLDTTWQSRPTGTYGVEIGLTYAASLYGRPILITAAYSGEKWMHIGQVGFSDMDLVMQGVVLRTEIRF
jgi:hypothetical protein